MSANTPQNLTKAYLDIERKVINLMLKYVEVIGEMVAENINPDFFDDRHQPLVQAIYYIHGVSDGKRLLTDTHYRNLLIEQGGKGDISIPMQVYHECMYGVHHSNSKNDFDLLKKQLVDSYVHRHGIACLDRFNQSVGKLGYIEATRQYIEELSAAVNLTEAKKSMFMVVDDLKDKYITSLEEKRNDIEPKIECGIPEIDEAMNVGFKAGHTSLYVAATGSHKTNMMLNVALNIFKKGYNVLFLPLEMDWNDFVTRIISNVTGVTYQSLLNPKQMTADDFKKVREASAWITHSNKFGILDVDEQISIPVLRRELEKRANYFKPKVVVVDYLGLLKTQSNFGQRHDLALGELTKSLKFLGKKYGFHIITAAQLGRADIRRLREEGGEAQLDSTSVKGSQEVSSDVEFIFALTIPPDENDRLKLHVIKARYGASGYTKDLRVEPNRCRIYSMEQGKQTPGQAGDAVNDDEWNLKLNEPVEKIVAKLEEVKFQGMNPDDLDDIAGM